MELLKFQTYLYNKDLYLKDKEFNSQALSTMEISLNPTGFHYTTIVRSSIVVCKARS